jgi:competence protein ComEC
MKNFKQHFKLYFILFLVFINVLVFYAVTHTSQDKMLVDFLDVGQGDAIFVTAPGGVQMLIDGGPNNSVLRELGLVMPFYDRSIDVVVATHADQDHIGGLVEVLKRYNVGLVVLNNTTSTSAVYAEFTDLIKAKNIKKEIIIKPEIIALGSEVEFDILFPNQNTAGWETNDSSIVGKLIYNENSVLLTGDSPLAVEKYIVGKYGNFLKSDVLKAGHHGSKNSNSDIFVSTALPDFTVISAGLDNRYGHPAPEALAVLNKYKTIILETLGGGMVRFESDGKYISSY